MTTNSDSSGLIFWGFFGLSFFMIGVAGFWAWLSLGSIPEPLIIHFSDYTGINQIGGFREIYGLLLTGLIVIALNLCLALVLRVRDSRWPEIIAGATLFISSLLFMALAAIISVNQ